MAEYQKVRSTLEISRHIAFCLDMLEPQYFSGINYAETVRHVNDILQGRAERTVEALLGELRQKGPGLARKMEHISRDIQAFEAQKELLVFPYEKSSSSQYAYKTFDLDPDYPLKIIDQQIYDQAARDGFPPDFFRKSYFDNVTLYCLPDDADLNFSRFQDCTFAVCRIRGARFDGTCIYGGCFHSCAIDHTTFFQAVIANTHFRDSSMESVSFQRAMLKHCNTIDCKMGRVNFLNATLDGCSYGRIDPANIRNLHTAAITQGGATGEECQRNREAIFHALRVPDGPESDRAPDIPPKRRRRSGPER